jgi:hypothetical protein
MPSVVDICNKALDKLGHGPITSLEDGTKSANLCNRNWSLIRDEVLREHPWNFAVKRAALAASTETPAWGFAYKFPIPADSLRILEVRDLSTGEYQVESGHILANDSVLYVRYIRKATDPNEYDIHFVEAAAARLAHELCEPLTQKSANDRKLYWTIYQEALIAAKRTDGQENPPQVFEEDEWIEVRY